MFTQCLALNKMTSHQPPPFYHPPSHIFNRAIVIYILQYFTIDRNHFYCLQDDTEDWTLDSNSI